MIEIKIINNPEIWENFVKSLEHTLFVQSWYYGEFYKSLGEQFWVFGIYENDNLVGGSLVLSTHAKRGNFLYLPYGPIINTDNRVAAFGKILIFLEKFAKKNNYDFLRFSPFVPHTEEEATMYKELGFKKAPIHSLAENTWLLELKQPEDQILSKMNKNHRNLINRCKREGVIIKLDKDPKYLSEFNKIHDETAKRHKFHRFTNEYVEKEFNIFANRGEALLFRAYLSDGRLDSAAIFIYYGTMSAYRHSGSLNLDKKLPSSYLLQWLAIQEALRRGMKTHNFWGVSPEDAPDSHPFKGITHFKKGFGGRQIDLLSCHDFKISNKYYFTRLIETARRMRRGF